MTEKNRKRRSSSPATHKRSSRPAPKPPQEQEAVPEPITESTPQSTAELMTVSMTEMMPEPISTSMPEPMMSPVPMPIMEPAEMSFHASLTECATQQAGQRWPRWQITSAFFTKTVQLQSPGSRVLQRAWSWLHKRYTEQATKRLRVAETVSLGEKRFVALVSVEGREFLIGGGASGVSLLAHLGRSPEPVDALRAAMAAVGDSE